MNTRMNEARRLEDEIANTGVSSRVDQVPILEENVNNDQAPVNPPPFTDENIRAVILQMVQAITTQEQAATTQAQAMTTQANQTVVPRAHQNIATLESSYFLRVQGWIKPPKSSLMKSTDHLCYGFVY